MGISMLAMHGQSYVVISKNDVNLRTDASTTAQVVGKGKKGTILPVTEKKQGWYQCKSPQTGEAPVWVSATVAEELNDVYDGQPARQLVDYGFEFSKTSSTRTSETTDTWSFTSGNANPQGELKSGSPILGTETIMFANTSGHARSNEKYYKGVFYPTYLVMTEYSFDPDGEFEPLDEPVYIYPATLLESGIFIDGEIYNDNAFDEDDW